MTATRRMGTESSETRVLLLDITERIMIEDGYAAVSSRRIAKDAGVTPALVHYYFGPLDDLFLAVLRRRAEQQLERQRKALESPQPLHALWRMSTEPAGSALLMELMALANHRKAIGVALAAHAERYRQDQLDAIRDHLDRSDIDTNMIDPAAILVLIAGMSRTIVMEEGIGMTTGLPETRALVSQLLERLEGPDEEPPAKTAKRRKGGG